ncbi:LysR family transcriptional regulator [Caballeronia sp. SEWSISQ10-4 2]|uniref:LysR family transcriptional regulator n=1 Tax=Caballeronia sp. SEWSISQ10-4 2 TaxID=2937438 RepID=UPI00264E2500|nr:LysR family transcriptional regulator [Caballeronia sp. SEWSISQ10-4 2]MDN7180513.1 LysR family transcriptional regulator [Caballeronia sp. SEWSISQ10-4 2]
MDRFASIAVFVAAVDEGSLVAAGRRFGLSASMAGKYVSALEAELNVRLLRRSTRSLSLTDAGRTYYVRCQRILEEFDDANREASDAHGTVRGTLRVAAPVTFGTLHMGEVVARYLDDHPHVNIEVSLDDRYVDLQSAGIDVAIRIGKLPDSDLVARRLAPCRMAMCASPAFLTREGTPRDPEDLRRAPRLAFNEAVSVPEWVLTDKQNREHVIDGPLRMQANNMQMLLAAALAGVGIAYGPTFVLGKDIRAGNLIKLLPDYGTAVLTINAVYPTARYVPSKVRQFIDYLAKAFKDEPPWDRY